MKFTNHDHLRLVQSKNTSTFHPDPTVHSFHHCIAFSKSRNPIFMKFTQGCSASAPSDAVNFERSRSKFKVITAVLKISTCNSSAAV